MAGLRRADHRAEVPVSAYGPSRLRTLALSRRTRSLHALTTLTLHVVVVSFRCRDLVEMYVAHRAAATGTGWAGLGWAGLGIIVCGEGGSPAVNVFALDVTCAPCRCRGWEQGEVREGGSRHRAARVQHSRCWQVRDPVTVCECAYVTCLCQPVSACVSLHHVCQLSSASLCTMLTAALCTLVLQNTSRQRLEDGDLHRPCHRNRVRSHHWSLEATVKLIHS